MGFAGCNRRVALGLLGSGTTAEAACAQSEAAGTREVSSDARRRLIMKAFILAAYSYLMGLIYQYEHQRHGEPAVAAIRSVNGRVPLSSLLRPTRA
jgi:hypothetical protein